MNENNVIITTGSANQIIHIPLKSSKLLSVSAFQRRASAPLNNDNDERTIFSKSNQISNTSFNTQQQTEQHSNDKYSSLNRISFVNNNQNLSNDNSNDDTNILNSSGQIFNNDNANKERNKRNSSQKQDNSSLSSGIIIKFICEKCGKEFENANLLERHKSLRKSSCYDSLSQMKYNEKQIEERILYEGLTTDDNNVVNDKSNLSQPLATIKTPPKEPRTWKKGSVLTSGRLTEPISCPNQGCDFITRWLQSLNKHVTHNCKFKDTNHQNDNKILNDSNNSTNSSSILKKSLLATSSPALSTPTTPTTPKTLTPKTTLSAQSTPQTSSITKHQKQLNATITPKTNLRCPICSMICKDYDDHIEHMKVYHNKRHEFQCTHCGKKFYSKIEIEVHVAEHKINNNDFKNNSSNQSKHNQSSTHKTTPIQTNNSLNNNSKSIEHNHTNNSPSSPNSLDRTWNCTCGKNYLSYRSFEIHAMTCPQVNVVEIHPKLHNNSSNINDVNNLTNSRSNSISSATTSMKEKANSIQNKIDNNNNNNNNDSMDESLNNNVSELNKPARVITRTELKALQKNNTNISCKFCGRIYGSLLALTNHLNRSLSKCRTWYIDNIDKELEKIQSKSTTSTNADEQQQENSCVNNTNVETTSEDHYFPNKPRPVVHSSDQNVVSSTFGVKIFKNKKYSYEEHIDEKGRKKVICFKCKKAFVGKKPQVAYHNHLRGSACVPPNKGSKTNADAIDKFEKTSEKGANRMEKNENENKNEEQNEVNDDQPNEELTEIEGLIEMEEQEDGNDILENAKKRAKFYATFDPSKKSFKYREPIYYCKLCSNKSMNKLQNRVQLGCHLTIYHGLPQVNVTTSQGDAYRCQTCSQLFISKYYYNMHRHECDQTSPYIGIVTEKEFLDALKKNNLNKKIDHIKLTLKKGFSCDSCGKFGFASENGVNMHKKYQCVKRNTQITNNSNVFSRNSNYRRRTRVAGPGGKTYFSESARLNAMAKYDASITKCDACGGGPYHSYYYFLQHQREFCSALRNNKNNQATTNNNNNNKRKRNSFYRRIDLDANDTEDNDQNDENENLVDENGMPELIKFLSPPPQKARKSMIPLPMNSVPLNSFEVLLDVMKSEQITKCSVCEEYFTDLEVFIKHRLTHLSLEWTSKQNIDPFRCEICNTDVEHYQRIQQHLILHLQNIKFLKRANFVDFEIKSNTFNENGLAQDDVNNGDNNGPIDGEKNETRLMICCSYCRFEAKSYTELCDHLKTCSLYCTHCCNGFTSAEEFDKHKETCTQTTSNMSYSLFKCDNCGLDFRFKQQLFLHRQACSIIYSSDQSGQIQEIIQKVLTCGVCGYCFETHEEKLKHEPDCFKDCLSLVGNLSSHKEIEKETNNQEKSNKESDNNSKHDSIHSNLSKKSLNESVKDSIKVVKAFGQVVQNSNSLTESKIIDLSTCSDNSVNLKEQHYNHNNNNDLDKVNNDKEVNNVNVKPVDENLIKQIKANLYQVDNDDEEKQFESLKKSFLQLVNKLIKDCDLLHQINGEATNSEETLIKMLNCLGEKPIEDENLRPLNRFRQNLHSFLKVSIKKDILIAAFENAESIDEAVIKLLNFECELN